MTKPTNQQKALIKRMTDLWLTIQTLRCMNDYEDAQLDEKVLNYLKKNNLPRDHNITESEREENIGPVMYSEHRQKRDDIISQWYSMMKELFELTMEEKFDAAPSMLRYKIEKKWLIADKKEIQPEQKYIDKVRDMEIEYQKKTRSESR